MAILQHETITSDSGFAKEIEESALTMIFDNMQKSQYHKPIPSTVRELACNGLDAIKERDAVKEILRGKATEEDYFIRRDDPMYKDSNFDKSYYDLKWLSNEPDTFITYVSKSTTDGNDYISFKDHGVGLGGKRLEGYMKLAYSTKRNSKLNIGKFGIGAKAPLSTNVNSFRMITAYNGKKFIFDIYSHKVDSAIPKMDLKTGAINKGYTFANDYTAYYEETTEKNFVEVIVETKKHHKQQYIDAAKSQLLYLKGVKLFIDVDGILSEVDISSDVMYEDEKIILAENRQYSKPHLVIDGVTYGYIDFLELELENKIGNVGIKVGADEVDVNPSRELVIWNDKTRDTVVTRFGEVIDIASSFVEKELKEVDFIKWLTKCTSTLAHTNSNSTLGRLSTLIDKSQIKPAYPLDKTIKYNTVNKFFNGFRLRSISESYDGKTGKNRIKRGEDIDSWSAVQFERAYIQNEKTSHNKDLYLYSTANPKTDRWANKMPILLLEPKALPPDHKLNDKQQKRYEDQQAKVLKYLAKSGISTYEDVAIPDDWKAKIEEMEKAEDKGVAYDAPTLSKAELREQNKETVYKIPSRESHYGSKVVFSVQERKIASILSIDENPSIEKLVYGFGNDREGLEFIYDYVECAPGWKGKVHIISISKDNEKLYKSLNKSVYIKDLFKQIDFKKKTITVDSTIIAYNTTRLISKKMDDLKFLSNYGLIDGEKSEEYIELYTYMSKNRHAPYAHDITEELDKFLDKLVEFQLFVKEVDGNAKMISKKSDELFGNKAFEDSNVIDMAIFEKYKLLLSYAEPIKTLLNSIKVLTDSTASMSEDLEHEIKGYIAHKLDLE